MPAHEGTSHGTIAPGGYHSDMVTGDSNGERDRLRARLRDLEAQQAELWLSGISVGGGLALDDRRWALEEEMRTIQSRLSEH